MFNVPCPCLLYISLSVIKCNVMWKVWGFNWKIYMLYIWGNWFGDKLIIISYCCFIPVIQVYLISYYMDMAKYMYNRPFMKLCTCISFSESSYWCTWITLFYNAHFPVSSNLTKQWLNCNSLFCSHDLLNNCLSQVQSVHKVFWNKICHVVGLTWNIFPR